MSQDILSISHLNKAFHVNNEAIRVLDDINIQIKEGEFITIVGNSGCGKSTLLKIIAGLVDYESGSVKVSGEEIEGPDIDRGMVFQEHRLLPWLTVKANVMLGLKHAPIPKNEKERIVSDHLQLVKLNGFEKAWPYQLSGGMAQRAGVARSLVYKPKILLMDEPFGALDALTKIQMQAEIQHIWSKEKITMILVTHDVDEAIYLGDRVVIMSQRPGRIEAIIPVQLARPRNRANSDFMYIKKGILGYFFTEADDNLLEYII
jgi:sulfonate transport system ATP-binding protein